MVMDSHDICLVNVKHIKDYFCKADSNTIKIGSRNDGLLLQLFHSTFSELKHHPSFDYQFHLAQLANISLEKHHPGYEEPIATAATALLKQNGVLTHPCLEAWAKKECLPYQARSYDAMSYNPERV